ncbi:MAG: tail fiber domain-containing protein [Bacteroidales bacterium]|nr:tail fiber domain-containing protein [Bacteroidales bacterium]
MATISGKRFQITDGASTPTNLFPYTVTEAVYGLSTVIENAKTAVTSVLSAVTLNGVSKAGTTASFYAPTTAGTTGQILKATTSGAPVWTSAALGASNKPVYLNSSGVLTEGVSCLPLTGGTISSTSNIPLTINSTHSSSQNVIALQAGGSAVSYIGYYPTYGVYIQNYAATGTPFINIASDGSLKRNNSDVFYHSGNFVAGTNYVSISGTETITGAKTFSNTVTLTYGTNFVFKGASNDSHSVRVLATYPNDLSHYDGSEWRRFWDSGNSNKSDVSWTCATLYASANVMAGAGAEGIYMNGTGICWHNSSNAWASDIMRFTSSGNVGIGTTSPSTKLHINGGNLRVCSRGTEYLDISTADVNVNYNAYDTDGFCSHAFKSNGTTVLFVNGNTKGINVYGYVESSGDQVVSSDLTLKTNLTPVTYSVADIAKARAVEFDWKDGRGHSMGSIAQDWLKIAPSLVHGEEGNMSLAYGQLALVNTIIEARAIESLQVHESEQDKEIRELRERVARLEMENERLRMN